MKPLDEVTVLEVGGLGPVPFAGMLLADLGATVIRIERPGWSDPWIDCSENDLLARGKYSVEWDMKSPTGRENTLALVRGADVLIEGFRPGVMERLELGPSECQEVNPALVFARLTGWGQSGPLASNPGHDINYIALAGVLDPIGPADGPPVPPLNLVGDFAAGGLVAVVGILAALRAAGRTGRGDVIDIAMTDGAALLMTALYGMIAAGTWDGMRGTSVMGRSPFYGVYETADARHVAVGAIEPRSFSALLELLELDEVDPESQNDPSRWPELKSEVAARFKTRSREAWVSHELSGTACVSPVLSTSEAARHPHNVARGAFSTARGLQEPTGAPRFDSCPERPEPAAPPRRGEHTNEVLQALAEDGQQWRWGPPHARRRRRTR